MAFSTKRLSPSGGREHCDIRGRGCGPQSRRPGDEGPVHLLCSVTNDPSKDASPPWVSLSLKKKKKKLQKQFLTSEALFLF